jgi:hypothetical protein
MTSASGFVISYSGSGKNGACVSNGYCDQLAYCGKGAAAGGSVFAPIVASPGMHLQIAWGAASIPARRKHKSKK